MSASNPYLTRRQPYLLDLILLGAVVSAVFVLTPFAIFDDAYISFRYADNLATTGELVFNPGERVEGMTNLLWTLVIAAMISLSHLPPERFVVLLSIAFVTWACVRLVMLGRILGAPRFAGLIAALLLLLTPDFVHTTINGLEGALYAVLLMEVIYQYRLRHLSVAYALLGLTFMTRPEAMALGLLFTGVVYYEQRSLRAQRLGLLIFGIIVAGVTIWRMAYYHSPLPNSVIAKSLPLDFWSSRLGLHAIKSAMLYVASFVVANWHYLIPPVFAGAWFLKKRRSVDTSSSQGIVAFCLGGILFSLVVLISHGGDWMGHYRLLMQYGVLYATLLLVLMAQRSIHPLLVGAVICYALGQTTYAVQHSMPGRRLLTINTEPNPYFTTVTNRLRRVSAPSDTISAEALGYISYHLRDHYVHDPIGLTNRHIARHGKIVLTFGKTDVAYTLGVVRPAVLIWHWANHLRGVDQPLLDQYQAFLESERDSSRTHVVQIRKDRVAAIAPAFRDWQPVRITENGTEPR